MTVARKPPRAGGRSLTFRDQAAWRNWLQTHHGSAAEVWIVYFKKGSGTASVTYPEALEEALCFGWIDGVRRRLDDDRFTQRFTPRRPGSRWSEVNRAHAKRLLAEGRMAPAGIANLPADLHEHSERKCASESEVPAELATGLEGNAAARATFTSLAPSYRRLYVRWIAEAKRPETRARRAAEAIAKLERGERLGLR